MLLISRENLPVEKRRKTMAIKEREREEKVLEKRTYKQRKIRRKGGKEEERKEGRKE